jgi:hypothetical protein
LLCRVLRADGPRDSVLPSRFQLQGDSLIEPSPLPRIVQVSPDHWPLSGWKVGASPRGSIAISLPIQDTAFGALHPQMHHMCAVCPVPKLNSFVILATNVQIFSGRNRRACHENFLQDGEGFLRYRLQCVTLVWMSFGPSGGNVGPGHSHVHLGPFVTRRGSAFWVMTVNA